MFAIWLVNVFIPLELFTFNQTQLCIRKKWKFITFTEKICLTWAMLHWFISCGNLGNGGQDVAVETTNTVQPLQLKTASDENVFWGKVGGWLCRVFVLTTAFRSTRALICSTFPETTLGKMEESAPLQNRYSSPAHKKKESKQTE